MRANKPSLLPLYFMLMTAGLVGCASSPPGGASAPGKPVAASTPPAATVAKVRPAPAPSNVPRAVLSPDAQEVVLYALGLLNVDYRFGGANPESGLDCSGMVSYIYEQAVGVRLPHNAAQIARLGREVARDELEPGDLVFFNTMNRQYSHVGIYIGEDRFVHAPATNGRIKVSSLRSSYFAQRFDAARRYFN